MNLALCIQGDQLNMALFFWNLGKSDLFSVHVYSSVLWTSHFLQGTRKIQSCLIGHPVEEQHLEGGSAGDPASRPTTPDILKNALSKVIFIFS